MKTISYSEILARVADQAGMNPDNLLVSERSACQRAISGAMLMVFEYCHWPALRKTEQRAFAPKYDDAEAVVAGALRYYPPTGEYYIALRATTGNEPATVASGEYTTNLAYWSQASRDLDPDVWSSTTDYAQGDQVFDPVTYLNFQAHTDPPVGAPPTDTTYWGVIVPLNPAVPLSGVGLTPVGRVEAVFERDPRIHKDQPEIPYLETEDGIAIREPELNEPWIVFQGRAPTLTGTDYNPASSYDPVDSEDYTAPITPTVAASDYKYFELIADAQVAVITARIVDVRVNGAGESCRFVRDISYTGPLDGTSGFQDAGGTKFARF